MAGDGSGGRPKTVTDEEPEISYEQARVELDRMVAALESGSEPLADTMDLWRRGEKMAGICQQWLDGYNAELAGVVSGAD